MVKPEAHYKCLTPQLSGLLMTGLLSTGTAFRTCVVNIGRIAAKTSAKRHDTFMATMPKYKVAVYKPQITWGRGRSC